MIRWIWIVLAANAFAAFAMSDEPFEPSETQIELAALNDTYRVARGLDAHRLDAQCCTIAQRWAERMAGGLGMRHGGGEQIIAVNGGGPVHAMSLWRNSGPHNSWLLSRTTRAGWGHAVSVNGSHYWAGAFRNEPTPKQGEPDDTSTDTPPQWRPRRGVLGWLRIR